MPSLGTAFFFLPLLLIGVEFVKCNDASPSAYTQSPVDNSEASKNSVYCEFDRKHCSWSSSGVWKWDDGQAGSVQLDGPLAHSKFYPYHPLIVNFNPDPKTGEKRIEKQFLTSPELEAPKKGTGCFGFNFYTLLSESTNDGITLFLVDINDETNKTAIWAHGNSEMDLWLGAHVDIVVSKKFKLSFEAYGRRGFVGLEKFTLKDGLCDTKKCDFEGGMCLGWTGDSQPAENEFKVVKAGSTSFKNPIDHTSHSQFGRFAYSKGPLQSGNIAQARLLSQEMEHLHSQCITFYFMRTSDDVSLKLLSRFTGNSSYQTLWQSNSTHTSNQWNGVTQSLTITDKMQFVFEVDYTKDATLNQALALDDVSLSLNSCDDLVSCSWLNKFCGWEPNRKFGLYWSVGTGRVERADKLQKKEPISTYTPLLYSDFTALEHGDTDTMELISQPLEPHPEGGYCLKLELNVIALGPNDEFSISQLDTSDKRKELWNFKELKQDPKDNWNRNIKIWVPNLSAREASRLTLTAKSSTPWTRIAIDSVHLNKGRASCGGVSGIPTKFTGPTSTTASSTIANPYAAMTCDFENYGKCQWKSHEPNAFQINSLENINDDLKRYLPQKDYTLKSIKGHFAYALNLKPSDKSDVAELIMPWPDTSSHSICVDFAYFYYTSRGGSGATLNLANSTGTTAIWHATPDISNNWHRVRFAYTRDESAAYSSIVFKTLLIQGVLALDDITITEGFCKYDASAHIDRVCDFEDGKTCLFEPASNSIGKHWRVYDGTTAGVVDRTTQTVSGHFYGFSFEDLPKDKKLTTPMETLSKSFSSGPKYEQCVRFSYMLQDVYQNTTVFGYKIEKQANWGDDEWDQGELIKKWEISGNTNKLWFTHRVPVTWTSDYTVRFYISLTDPRENNRNTKIFIDDFTVSFDACQQTGCTFNDGDACSLEPIPVTDKHIEKEVVSVLAEAKVGAQVLNSYMNNYVEQLWRIYSAQIEASSMSPIYPIQTSTHSRYGNYLLMTANDDWQRAIVATERFVYNVTHSGVQPHMCLSFHINKLKDTYLEVYKGDSFGSTSELMWIHNSETKNWEKVNIMIERTDNKTMDVYFYFVGTIGKNGKKGYIAIDDYAVNNNCV